jgi:rRNA maturation protein Nop10
MKQIHRCVVCNHYTFTSQHCEKATKQVRPAKFSLLDKYGKYRREVKKQELVAEGKL